MKYVLLYINEVTSQVSDGSNAVLFADDIALYRVLTSPDDYVQVQSDINSIADGIEEYHLTLHSGKCCMGHAIYQKHALCRSLNYTAHLSALSWSICMHQLYGLHI